MDFFRFDYQLDRIAKVHTLQLSQGRKNLFEWFLYLSCINFRFSSWKKPASQPWTGSWRGKPLSTSPWWPATSPGSAWALTTGKINFCAPLLISHILEDTALIFIKSSLSVPWRKKLHFQFWGLIPKRLFYGLKMRFFSDNEGTGMNSWCIPKLLVTKGTEVLGNSGTANYKGNNGCWGWCRGSLEAQWEVGTSCSHWWCGSWIWEGEGLANPLRSSPEEAYSNDCKLVHGQI